MVQFATELSSQLPLPQRQKVAQALRNLGVRVVVVRTVPEQMLYDTSLIVVEAGKPVEIVLINDDLMQHNLVVVTPGAVAEIGPLAEKMPPEPDAEGRLYVPASAKVLFATKMLNPGERAKLSFTAPEEPGDYQYVCTFPGHWMRMLGTLAVVRDVEAYLAKQASQPVPVMTEWKVEDLATSLGDSSTGNPLNGQKLFQSTACAQCHKLGKDGYAYGPDLTDLFARYKNDRVAVLRAILEPSTEIAERYRNYEFERLDGETFTGMIVEETADQLTVHSGPADSLIQTVPKKEIRQRQPQALSVMPAGLLNGLSRPQILDLMAYLRTGGQLAAHEHRH